MMDISKNESLRLADLEAGMDADITAGLPSITTRAVWPPREIKPPREAVYPCLNLDGSQTCRSYEHDGWWAFGEDGWVPNESISYWAEVEPPEIVTAQPAGPVS